MLGIFESTSIQLASSQAYQEHFENPPGALKVCAFDFDHIQHPNSILAI